MSELTATLNFPSADLTAAADAPSKPVGILFLDHTAQLSGGEIALLRLISNLNRKRFRPIVALLSDGPLVNKIRAFNIDVHVLPIHDSILNTRKDSLGIKSLGRLVDIGHLLAHIRKLTRLIRSLDVQIVHCNSLKADIIGGITGRLARKKVIWHIRDRIATDYLPTLVVMIFRKLLRILPHYVIANSAATLQTIGTRRLASTIPSGIAVSRATQVVHDGWVESPQATPRTPDRSDVRRVGMVGRLSRWKGQHIFIEAAAIVLQRGYSNIRFCIVGSALFGEDLYEEELKSQVNRLDLEGFVEFLGFREDVATVIENLGLLVHASIAPEPFGQVIIEGMAAGKPVIATRAGGVTEIIEDRITGRLVPMDNAPALADAICELISNPQAAAAMGAKARRCISENFSIESTALKVQHVYESLLSASVVNR